MGDSETGDRMVAVCDILGFKDLVLSRDVSNLMEGELSIFRKLIDFSVNKDDDLSCRNVIETAGWLLFTTMHTVGLQTNRTLLKRKMDFELQKAVLNE